MGDSYRLQNGLEITAGDLVALKNDRLTEAEIAEVYRISRTTLHKVRKRIDCPVDDPITRTGELIEFRGERRSLREWAVVLGFEYTTLVNRIKHYGWDIEKAFTETVHRPGGITDAQREREEFVRYRPRVNNV